MKQKLRNHDILPMVVAVFVMFALLPSTTFAQSRRITGKVSTGPNAEVLQGVNVLIKGNTRKGAVTDGQGAFSMEAAPEDVLVFSFIGFKTKELKVGSNTTFTVSLDEDATQLSELIVTGTRNTGRTVLETPVPVDFISIK